MGHSIITLEKLNLGTMDRIGNYLQDLNENEQVRPLNYSLGASNLEK